jgi:hypothetical protein
MVGVFIENDRAPLYHDHGGHMRKFRLAMVVIAAIALGACLSAPSSVAGDPYDGIIDLVNDGSAEVLASQSSIPMFFDGELVVRVADIELVWAGLRSSGFEISQAGYVLEPATPADYVRVADTFDMKSFFSAGAGIPAESRWITADSSSGKVLLLLGEFRDGLPTIYGLTRVDS